MACYADERLARCASCILHSACNKTKKKLLPSSVEFFQFTCLSWRANHSPWPFSWSCLLLWWLHWQLRCWCCSHSANWMNKNQSTVVMTHRVQNDRIVQMKESKESTSCDGSKELIRKAYRWCVRGSCWVCRRGRRRWWGGWRRGRRRKASDIGLEQFHNVSEWCL